MWRARLTACATLRWNFNEVPVKRRGNTLPWSLINFNKKLASL